MKTVNRYFYLLILLLPLVLYHCGTKSSEPTPAQTVTIVEMSAGQLTDNDGDNYLSYFNLYFDLDINRDEKKVFVLVGIRFHDVADTASYWELFRTDIIDVKKDDDPWVLGVDLPSNEYPPAGYDLLFWVIDGDDIDVTDPENLRVLAEMSATDQELLSNIPLEHIDDDLLVIITDLWLSDSVDVDEDGYFSSFRLNFNLDVPLGSKDVFVMLAARYHDPGDTEAYDPYIISQDLNITGNDLDFMYFDIVNSVPDFLQDSYDFLFIVFDANDRELRLAETSATDNSKLRNVLIEPTDTENIIWIFDALFKDPIDFDGDGYNSEATLELDIDEENGSGADVYVEISYRPFGTTDYMSLGPTGVFNVIGVAYDPILIDINQHQFFDHGAYDFKIELKFGGYNIVEDWIDGSTFLELSGVKLELQSEDQQIIVDDAWQSSEFDNDSDSYNYWVVMSIDIGVSVGEADVLVRPGYKLTNESSYTFTEFTDTLHVVSGSFEGGHYLYQNFNRGMYDIAFQLSFLGSESVQLTYDATNDPDLAGIRLENWSEDGSPP
jgi:hypothetical protein